jgi:hypothetical protein
MGVKMAILTQNNNLKFNMHTMPKALIFEIIAFFRRKLVEIDKNQWSLGT